MFRVVFQRRLGKGSLFALTLLLAGRCSGHCERGTAGSTSSRPALTPAATTRLAAPAPGGGTVIFDENTVTRAIAFYGVGLSGHVGVFANDESGLYIGDAAEPPLPPRARSVGTAGTLAAEHDGHLDPRPRRDHRCRLVR